MVWCWVSQSLQEGWSFLKLRFDLQICSGGVSKKFKKHFLQWTGVERDIFMHAGPLSWWQTGLGFSCHPYPFLQHLMDIEQRLCTLAQYGWGYCTNYIVHKTHFNIIVRQAERWTEALWVSVRWALTRLSFNGEQNKTGTDHLNDTSQWTRWNLLENRELVGYT